MFFIDCGGTFNNAEGFFATPGYPKKYPSDMECEWIINVAPGKYIMSIHHLNLKKENKNIV